MTLARVAPIATPDGRYLVVRGRLWRKRNPALPAPVAEALVQSLMAARRAVKEGLKLGDADRIARARAAVDAAKVALGERGPLWWSDGSPDENRRLVRTSSYAEWYAGFDMAKVADEHLYEDRDTGE